MEWLKEFFTGFLTWLYEVLMYIPQKLFDLFLQGLLVIIDSLPLPDFMTQYRITDLIAPEILYFLSQSGLDVALPIVGSAYLFYFFRRILTLGIW
jgi:hypothetical protein